MSSLGSLIGPEGFNTFHPLFSWLFLCFGLGAGSLSLTLAYVNRSYPYQSKLDMQVACLFLAFALLGYMLGVYLILVLFFIGWVLLRN